MHDRVGLRAKEIAAQGALSASIKISNESHKTLQFTVPRKVSHWNARASTRLPSERKLTAKSVFSSKFYCRLKTRAHISHISFIRLIYVMIIKVNFLEWKRRVAHKISSSQRGHSWRWEVIKHSWKSNRFMTSNLFPLLLQYYFYHKTKEKHLLR